MLHKDVHVAQKSSEVKADYRIITPYALQIATAITIGAEIFLTNDKNLTRIKGVTISTLADKDA